MRAFQLLMALLGVIVTFGVTHLQGAVGTETGNQDRRPKTWRETITYLDPERTMFTQLLMRLGSGKKVTDPEFKLFEREHRTKWARVTEALDASETDIDVDDGTSFRGPLNGQGGDVIRVDDEYMTVSSVAANTLTVIRGALGTTAATHVTNSWALNLFEAYEENGLNGQPLTTDFETITNYTQIFKVPYGISRTNKQTRKRGPSDLSLLRTEALQDYKRQLEHAFFWGKRRQENNGNKVKRYTGGIDEFIQTNRMDADGGLGFGDIGWIVNQTTRYGGSKKIWFAGRDARQQLDALGLEYMRIKSSENVLGMAVDGIRTSFGEFILVTHHGLENAFADRIYIVDPQHVDMAVLMAMKHESNIEENNRDGELHQFIGECGLWLALEEAHAVILNVSDVVQ